MEPNLLYMEEDERFWYNINRDEFFETGIFVHPMWRFIFNNGETRVLDNFLRFLYRRPMVPGALIFTVAPYLPVELLDELVTLPEMDDSFFAFTVGRGECIHMTILHAWGHAEVFTDI